MANIVDNLLLKASARGSVARTARLQQMKRQDNNNAICDDLTGWPQGEAVALSMYQTDSAGIPDEDSVTDWVAEVNGNTLINMKLTSGNNRDYDTLNTVVTINFTSEWANRLIEALLKFLNQDGTFRDNIVDGKHIRDSAVTERKLADGAVTGSKIKDGSVEPKHLQATSETDAHGFLVRIGPGGKRIWTKRGMATVTDGWTAGSWKIVVISDKLPVGLQKLDSCIVTSSVSCVDSVISTSGIAPTGNSLWITTTNRHNGSIPAKDIMWSVRIEEL